MKKILMLLCALTLTACATHTPPPEPKGTPFPINGYEEQNNPPLLDQQPEAEHGSAESR